MSPKDKPLVWLSGEVKSPPFSTEGRVEAGFLLRRLQGGHKLGMPHSRPMPGIGRNCHELRVQDAQQTWRIIYRVDTDAVIIVEVFPKKQQTTPASVIRSSQKRLREFDALSKGNT